ncbi:MAG: glycoside hydrolase family 3 N-terminal domain-containing protein [Hyphomicrobiaceae bacterium]|nr:glycoside hydrolase family 3 N-terminal domain-containing protein [Hyphomicrobiaceae bacterium]
MRRTIGTLDVPGRLRASVPVLLAIAAVAGPAISAAHARQPRTVDSYASYLALKARVLATDPDTLRRLGSHLIVGYHGARDLDPLLERGALGGIFITARNVKSRDPARLADDIARMRALADPVALRPLFVAADQEGGHVSRLTPPLPRQPSIGTAILAAPEPADRAAIVSAYADRKAGALAGIGVNLNFAPVVDIRPKSAPRDGQTRIMRRTIADSPEVIGEAAGQYCARLAAAGVLCTLKHFPGLRLASDDTHARPTELGAGRDRLEATDWLPFRSVLAKVPAAIMVGHPHALGIDPDRPASTSAKVIDGIIRKAWGFDGLVITDDLYMGAIRRAPGGLARAAVDALAAGADLVLVEHMGRHVYEILDALIEAERKGRLPATRLAMSRARLLAIAERFPGSARAAGATSARP